MCESLQTDDSRQRKVAAITPAAPGGPAHHGVGFHLRRVWCDFCPTSALSVGFITAHSACAKPNVIVIVSDDAGWADFGFIRDATSQANPGTKGAIPTPHLDQLANQGVAFTNAYGASVCAISRATLTTGIYAHRFGLHSNILSDATAINAATSVQGLPVESKTIWERMQGVGYSTAAIGKWHLGHHANGGGQLGNRPENQGIELFEGLWGGSRSYNVGAVTDAEQTLRRTSSNGAGTVTSSATIESQFNGQYLTDVLGDRSVQYIRDQAPAADPFFLYSSFTASHGPLQATAADLAYIDSLGIAGFTGNRRTQAAMVYALDRNIGKIIGSLSDPNGDENNSDSIAEETLIMFMNDNGGDCCDVDPNSSSNGILRNGKGTQFEGAYRVPFIVAGAGVATNQRGTVSSDIVSVVDVLPTSFLGAGQGGAAARANPSMASTCCRTSTTRSAGSVTKNSSIRGTATTSRPCGGAIGNCSTIHPPAISFSILNRIPAKRTTSSRLRNMPPW